MGTKESTQEMTETRDFDLPQDRFQLKDHPWLAAEITVEDEIRYALDEIRLWSVVSNGFSIASASVKSPFL